MLSNQSFFFRVFKRLTRLVDPPQRISHQSCDRQARLVNAHLLGSLDNCSCYLQEAKLFNVKQ